MPLTEPLLYHCPMIFMEDHWESYDEPTLGIHLLRDDAGTPFLLFAGPEPDLHWERFIAAVPLLVAMAHCWVPSAEREPRLSEQSMNSEHQHSGLRLTVLEN